MHDLLTGALKTEMSRFDDTGVHRADGHLVHLPAFHAEERGIGRGVAKGVPHRLEPRVSDGNQPVLFPDLALEEVGLGVLGCQGWVRSVHRFAAGHAEDAFGVHG